MYPILLTLALFSADPQLTVLAGAKLARVPGPIAPVYPDPVTAGSSRHSADIQLRMRREARGVSVQAVAVPTLPVAVEDQVNEISGWKAYRVEAPAGATVHARLRGVHEAWFQVHTFNRWGQMEKGMLQNRIPTGNPEASFINPKTEATTLFFVVDTTVDGAEKEPFRLEFTVK